MQYCSFSGESMSLKRDNPLYESQEIRMEMFADASDEETEGKLNVINTELVLVHVPLSKLVTQLPVICSTVKWYFRWAWGRG